MINTINMKPVPPFFLMAFYNWLNDSGQKPMIHVVITNQCNIPKQFMNQDKINFNIEPNAVNNLFMDDKGVSFEARFNQTAHSVYIPIECIYAISCSDIGFYINYPFIPQYQNTIETETKPQTSENLIELENNLINDNAIARGLVEKHETIPGQKIKHLTVVK